MTPNTAKLLRAVVEHTIRSVDPSNGYYARKAFGVRGPADYSVSNELADYVRLVRKLMRPPDLPTNLLPQAPTDSMIEACVKECLADRAAAAFEVNP